LDDRAAGINYVLAFFSVVAIKANLSTKIPVQKK